MNLPKHEVAIFWFRRDLRLDDNAGLYNALASGNRVLPIFIFDPTVLNQFEKGENAQVEFILNEIFGLQQALKRFASTIKVFYQKPIDVFKELCHNHIINGVYANEDYELASVRRDTEIRDFLHSHNIPFQLHKDHVIFAKDEVVKDDGNPYTVFTPYSKRWLKCLSEQDTETFDSQSLLKNLYPFTDSYLPTLDDLGFMKRNVQIPSREFNEDIIRLYDKYRDYPSIEGTSRLGIHLRFGTISIRKLVKKATALNSTYLNELIWRDFYHSITYHFPYICEGKAFKMEYDNIPWKNNEFLFKAWSEGKTGFPLVDAGIRQLNSTGYMHNRVRMLASSFLVKHLLIDWRWGEAYFANKLIDFDFAANNGGWQWAASCGCDAVPYFRIFNPELQASKFDKDNLYIRRWVSEYNTEDYVKPIVDHKQARTLAIESYKNALNSIK